jgi:hypothetical protein
MWNGIVEIAAGSWTNVVDYWCNKHKRLSPTGRKWHYQYFWVGKQSLETSQGR